MRPASRRAGSDEARPVGGRPCGSGSSRGTRASIPLFDEAAENVAECARRLRDLLDDFADDESPPSRRAATSRSSSTSISDCEQRGDELTRTILRRLNSSFVTPFDREDIHALTEELDDVVDEMQAAADLLVLHHVEKPLPEVKRARRHPRRGRRGERRRSSRSCRGCADSRPSSRRSTGSRARPTTSTADRVAHLFSGEFKAFEVLKWKDVVEAIEASVNAIENISDIVESIVLKHA